MTEPSARDIAQMLRSHAESVGLMIFPGARKAGGFLNIGSLHGEPGDSLKIRLTGPKAGTWADYAESKGHPLGTGDMLKLIQHTIAGGSIYAAVQEAKRFLSIDSMDPRALERMKLRAQKARAKADKEKLAQDERRRINAEGLWQSAGALTPSSPAVRYLESRGIDFARLGRLPGSIRFHHQVLHAETSELKGERIKLPAMVTRFVALDGRHAATHLTFLKFDGAHGWIKLPKLQFENIDEATGEVSIDEIDAAKKIQGPAWGMGAHLPLWKGKHRHTLRDIPAGTPVELSEGIEDGLSYAMANPEARVIAAGTLGLIGQLQLPPQAGDLNLLAQNDTKRQPIESLEEAVKLQQQQAARHAAERGSDPRAVAQRRPPPEFKDWNDWLRGIER